MISVQELEKRVPQKWHGRIDGLHQNFSQNFDQGKLPTGWVARSWMKNPDFYQKNQKACLNAMENGFTFDDTLDATPFPMPK